jgi:hypothetical protein
MTQMLQQGEDESKEVTPVKYLSHGTKYMTQNKLVISVLHRKGSFIFSNTPSHLWQRLLDRPLIVTQVNNAAIYILWHIDPLLGNDRKTNNETTVIARQQLRTVLEPLLGSGPCATMEALLEAVFSMGPLQDYIT